jgi:tRNA-2-methylthio-N6-dimethylallyladenosine synthase
MRYDSAFTFIYSPRAGTAAEKLPGRIDKEVASERIQKLIDLQEKITQERLQSLVGSVQDVLVDGPSARGKALTGKSGRNISVNFAGDKTFVGTVQEIEITATASNTLRGKMKGR